ncbi:DNRLRE domain-containing protein [Micromonospora chersina]|uniref:CBM96 family carbohydrate-binding protein n=1 Tax=Micromonospora chersina TaxID=47854 RepID=UPI0033C59697
MQSPEPDPVRPPRLSRRTLLGGLGLTAAATIAGTRVAGPAAADPGDGALSVVVTPTRAGRGMPLVGYNTGHYLPGSNTSAWLAYSRVNAVRFFASFEDWCPDEAFDPGAGVTDVDGFDAAKEELRRSPEENRFVDWALLREVFEHHVYSNTNFYRLNYQLAELKRLGITPILEAAQLRWNSPWSGLWQQWQKHYALTYHLARDYDVERFNFINEPDHPSAARDIVDQQVYVRGLQIASDAVHCAIADVNQRYGKSLRALVHAPVVTHVSSSRGNDHMDADPDADARDDEHGWGEIALRNLRTDYHGNRVDHDIFSVFDTHQYNKTAETYAYEFAMMRQRMREYTPTGVELPIVYSEFNRRNTSAFETSGDDLDSPLIYGDLARIWGAAVTAQAEGMIVFKFQDTMRANGIPYGTGCYHVEHDGVHDIHGATKAAEVNRLLAKGFAGEHRRLLSAATGDGGTVPVSYDPRTRCHHLWLPHPGGSPSGPVSLDLGGLGLGGGQVVVEEVSRTHSGGITTVAALPADGRITLTRPADAVWLVTVADAGESRSTEAYADATVSQSGPPAGGAPQSLAVALDPGGSSAVSYLAFDFGGGPAARRAVLELHASSTDGEPLTVMVYAITDTSWAGSDLTWESAPYLDPAAVRPTAVGDRLHPAGQLTATGVPGPARLDVTDALRHARGRSLGFLLIRERKRAQDTADDGRRLELSGRSAPRPDVRPRLHLYQ